MPAPIRLATFRGERPGTGPRVLPDGYAQSARNCRLIDGQIVPIGAVTNVETITEVLDHRATTSDGYESTWQYVRNRKFSREKLFWTEGDGWTIVGGKAVQAAGSAGTLSQSLDRLDAMPRIKEGLSYTVEFTIDTYTAGTLTPKLGGTSGTAVSSADNFSQNITAGGSNKLIEFTSNSAGDYDLDDVSVTINIGSFAAAAGGSDAWLRLAWDASDNPGEYDGWTLKIVGGTGSGQSTTINTYHGNTNGKFHVADVADDWGTVPDNTSVYELYRPVTADEVKSLYLFARGQELSGVTVASATDLWTYTAHGMEDDQPVTMFSSGTLPTGFSAGTTYFVRDSTPDTFKLAASIDGSAVDATDTGSGTHTIRMGLWCRWGTDVDVVRSPLSGDKKELTMWTGQGVPKLSYKGWLDDDPDSFGTTGYPIQYYTLGVPEPRIDEDEDTEAGGGAGDDFYLTYQNDVNDTDLHSDLQAVGWDGSTYKRFLVEISAGVRLGASASGDGMFIQSSWPVGTEIIITNIGTINGGHGAGGAANGGNGGNGGRGIYVHASFATAIGNVTTDFSTDDKIDLNSHGFTNGMAVHFDSTGTLPDGLSPDTIYYVINKSTNDFEVSTTRGGSAVDIQDDGTGTHSVYGVTLQVTNDATSLATGLIAGGGGGGGGGGLGRGKSCVDNGKTCTSNCCSSAGGAGGKGQGNTAKANGSSAAAACGGTTAGGSCATGCDLTAASHQGGAGGNGSAYATAGNAGSNSSGQATGCSSGTSTGGSAGSAGNAIDGSSKMTPYTDNGTTTGSEVN